MQYILETNQWFRELMSVTIRDIQIGSKWPRAVVSWAGIKAAGMLLGAYHYARPDLGNTPEAEAKYFLEIVQAQGWCMPNCWACWWCIGSC